MRLSRRRCRRKIIFRLLVFAMALAFVHHTYFEHLGKMDAVINRERKITTNATKANTVAFKTSAVVESDPIRVKKKRTRVEFYRYHVEVDESGRYGIIQDAYTAEEEPIKNDVTLATILWDMQFEEIAELVKQWNGQMEVGVYINSVQLWEPTMELLTALRDGDSKMRRFVSWHIVCPLWEDFDSGLQYLSSLDQINEQDIAVEMELLREKYDKIATNSSETVVIPSTLLINTAYDACATEFFFYLDIDLTPCDELRTKFLNFAGKNNLFAVTSSLDDGKPVGPGIRISKCGQYRKKIFSVIPKKPGEKLCEFQHGGIPPGDVYVVPTFQTSSMRIPRTVLEIKRDYRMGSSSPYYQKVFSPAYEPTSHKTWVDISEGGIVDCAYEVKYTLYYEPFIIVRKGTSKYDERFNGFAFIRSNYHVILAAAGYKFKVLKNVFLVHEGWKEKDYLTEQNKEEIKNAFPRWWRFVKETEKKYGLIHGDA